MTKLPFLMSLASIMSAAATEAQARLAEIGGAAAGEDNSIYKGASYIAVYGQPIVTRIMLPSGGYKQSTMVPTTARRIQFTLPPVANDIWTRTDISPQIAYRILKVNLHDPYVYGLTLVRPGEVQ